MKDRFIFVGFHAVRGYPVFVELRTLRGHMHILGGSGSGKTSMGGLPILLQVIRGRGIPVIVIDLKGDWVLLQSLRIAAAEQGTTFRYFTNQVGHSTYVFDPFGPLRRGRLTVGQVAEIVLEALELQHGSGYGKSFYSRIARLALTEILRRYPNLESFAELRERMSSYHFESDRIRADAMELVSVLESLATLPQLNLTMGHPEAVKRAAIRMADVIENNEVCYFWLPATRGSSTSREVANLAAAAIVIEAGLRAVKRDIVVFIDEFQVLASRSFGPMLEQARSFGINFIIANQAMSQLKSHDAPALKGVVETSTRVKWYFSATEPEVLRTLVQTSGESPFIEESYSESDVEDEEFRPRVRVAARQNMTDVLRYSATPDLSIMQVTRDEGLTQYGGLWFGVRTLHVITREEYDRRELMPWPEGGEGTIIAGGGLASEPGDAALDVVETHKPPRDSAWAKRLNKLSAERKDGSK